MLQRIAGFALRLVIAAAIMWAIISIPLPVGNQESLILLRTPIVVLIFIVYTGKTLYDTFFYERTP